MGYLSVIKVHLRPSWSKVLLTDIEPLAVQEWLKGLNLSRKSQQNVKAAFHRVLELAMLWELMPAQRNPLSLVEIKGGAIRPRKKSAFSLRSSFNRFAVCWKRLLLGYDQLTGLQIALVTARLDSPYKQQLTVVCYTAMLYSR